MWALDYEAEVESDLSVFHRVDDPLALDSPRYFRLVSLLPHYDGAVRHALLRDVPPPSPAAVPGTAPGHPGAGVQHVDDPAALAALTSGPGALPGIAYRGG